MLPAFTTRGPGKYTLNIEGVLDDQIALETDSYSHLVGDL